MKSTELVPADIILTSRPLSDSLLSAVIKLGTMSAYSHAMLFVGGNHVIEAIGEEGVTRRGLSLALHGCDRVTVFRHAVATPDRRQRIVAFAERCLGGEYAKPGVITGSGAVVVGTLGMAALAISGVRAVSNAYREHSGKKRSYFCSEMVADAFLNAGLPLGIYGRTPSLMNPGDIGEYASENPQTLLNLGALQIA